MRAMSFLIKSFLGGIFAPDPRLATPEGRCVGCMRAEFQRRPTHASVACADCCKPAEMEI